MSYCAICGRAHDPDLPCFDSASHALRSAGVGDHRDGVGPEFKKVARLADRWIIKLLLGLLAFIAAFMLLYAVLEEVAF